MSLSTPFAAAVDEQRVEFVADPLPGYGPYVGGGVREFILRRRIPRVRSRGSRGRIDFPPLLSGSCSRIHGRGGGGGGSGGDDDPTNMLYTHNVCVCPSPKVDGLSRDEGGKNFRPNSLTFPIIAFRALTTKVMKTKTARFSLYPKEDGVIIWHYVAGVLFPFFFGSVISILNSHD